MSTTDIADESVQVEGLDQNDEGLTEVTTELETDFQQENGELPPDYDSLASPLSVTDGGDYLTHLDFVADSVVRQEQSTTLIAEAPPSYKQLFGNVEASTETSNKDRAHQERRHSHSRRPHTRPRRRSGTDSGSGDTDLLSQLSKKFSSIKTATLGLVAFVAALYLLSLAMVIVGSLNINVCQSLVVPAYLTVAGLIQISSLLFQTTTWIAEKRGVEKCGAIRIFDCFGFLLFIWLLIGSNWIVRVGWSRSTCTDDLYFGTDYVFLRVNSTVTDSDYEVPENDVNFCRDCASGVYLFTSVVIVLQYIMIILVCMSCCSVLYRSKRSHHSRPRV